MKDTVFVFAEAPRLGAVKRRHDRPGSAAAVTRGYRQTLSRLLRTLARDRRFRTVIAMTRDRAAVRQPRWACRLPAIVQERGDPGQRMAQVAKYHRRGRVAILSGEMSGITAGDVAYAFRMLGQAHACFGPSADGGYWLVALSVRRPDAPFGIVRWGSEWALGDTLANFVGRQVALLRELPHNDVEPAECSASKAAT